MNILKKLLILVMFVVITISACSTQAEPTNTPKPTAEPNAETTRDLSTSEEMLVGHWEAPKGEYLPGGEIYLGELSTDGKGKLYQTFDFVDYCERAYEIISEDEDTYNVRFYKEYTPKYADYSFQFTDGGFTLSYAGELVGEFTYVDSETEPDNLGPLAERDNEYLTTTSLTGHWGHIPEADGNSDENWHVYFGRINDDGEGIYYSSGETVLKFNFKILNEDGRDYDLQLNFECGGDEILERWEVSEDGQNLNWILEDKIYRFKYIDSNTEP